MVDVSTEVESPVFNGIIIVCKTLLVNDVPKLRDRITHILEMNLLCKVHVYRTEKEDTFVITLGSAERMLSDKNIRTTQQILRDRLKKEFSSGGNMEVTVYPDADIYKDGHVEANDYIYEGIVSQEMSLEDNFTDVLTQQYTPSIDKRIPDIPKLIF